MEARNLHLHGALAADYGPTHSVVAGSLPDALRIVDCNHPGFLRRVRMGSFHCLHGSEMLEESNELAEHQLFLPRSTGDFHLVPVAEGGKGRTGKMIFSIVVGGALLATGVGGAAFGLFGAGAGGLGLAGTGLAISFSTMSLLGGAMLLGGISQLLTPSPSTDTSERKPTSFTFGGPASVSDEGGPIPLIYGEVITGGVTIASSLRDGYGSTAHESPKGSFTGINWGGQRLEFDQTLQAF